MTTPLPTLTGILLLALFTMPPVADAQPRSMPRVGVLSPGKSPPDDAFRQQEHFEAGLRELGWTPGSNIVIDYATRTGSLTVYLRWPPNSLAFR
jgi:hypothetical protein